MESCRSARGLEREPDDAASIIDIEGEGLQDRARRGCRGEPAVAAHEPMASRVIEGVANDVAPIMDAGNTGARGARNIARREVAIGVVRKAVAPDADIACARAGSGDLPVS